MNTGVIPDFHNATGQKYRMLRLEWVLLGAIVESDFQSLSLTLIQLYEWKDVEKYVHSLLDTCQTAWIDLTMRSCFTHKWFLLELVQSRPDRGYT